MRERERKNDKETYKKSSTAAVEIPIYVRATHERIFFLAIRMLLILPLSLTRSPYGGMYKNVCMRGEELECGKV
jgi:hypothetical protein